MIRATLPVFRDDPSFQRTLRVVVLMQPDAEPKAQSVILLSTDDQLPPGKFIGITKRVSR